MKKLIALAAGVSSVLVMNGANAALIERSVDIMNGHVAKSSLKIQFSGGCTGSSTITEGIGLRFMQRFETDSNNNVLAHSLAQEFSIINTNHTPSNGNADKVLLTTGHMQSSGYPTPAPLVDSAEKLTEVLKKEVATVTYVNKSPNVLIRQFNDQDDNLTDGTAKGLANIKSCLADYLNDGIDTAHETQYAIPSFGNTPLLDKYIVDSSKKTNINAKFMFTKNSSTNLYTQAKSINVKATMSGVLQPKATKCSGNFTKWPLKSNCKTLAPVKYKINFVMSGDIVS